MSTYACPFCEGEVAEQLALHGGRCPNCFGEIPGEEAATDPGEAVKAVQAVADARRARIRVFAPVFFGLPVLGALVVFSVLQVMKSEPELEVMDLDDIEFAMPGMDSLLVATAAEETDAATTKSETRSSQRRSSAGERKIKIADIKGSSVDENNVLASLGDPGSNGDTNGPRGRRNSGSGDLMPDFIGSRSEKSMQTSMSVGASSAGGVQVNVGRKRLKDTKQIQQMVLGVLQRQLPGLRTCYESRLRVDSNLSGKWTLYFTVTSDGSAGRPKAVGQSTKDELLETCMVNKISKWRFQPIQGSMPFKKSVTFDLR